MFPIYLEKQGIWAIVHSLKFNETRVYQKTPTFAIIAEEKLWTFMENSNVKNNLSNWKQR